MPVNSKVHIDLGARSYDIHIGRGLLQQIADYVPLDLEGRSLFVLTDENVSNPHAMSVYAALKSARPESIQMLALPPGEQTKCFAELERVVAWLLDHGVNRQSVLFAVGGGVIGDLGGFAAASTLRGIDYVQVPTSLLAQVDSSVGGKTGIDMPQGKNLVGAFHQPASVVCDIETLATLPRRELLAGYAEVAKYGLINDPEFFIWLEKEGIKICELTPESEAPLVKAIETSCRKKAEIVEQDEVEKGLRALLNLGHTFGHAVESASSYDGRVLHGEAVAIGTVMAFHLSHRMGQCSEQDVDRVEKHFSDIGLPTKISMIFPPLEKEPEDFMDYMKNDKKVFKGKITFILAHGIGKAFISRDVAPADVRAVLDHSMSGA